MSGNASRRAELGRHFLAGGWLAAELAEQAGVGAGDLVLEIGAGTCCGGRSGSWPTSRSDRPRPSSGGCWATRGPRWNGPTWSSRRRRPGATPAGSPETIAWGAWYALAAGRRLGPSCFRPPPRVGAAVLVASRRRPPLVAVGGHRRFTGLVGAAFRQPGLPLRRGLVPPLTYRQLRRLARDLGFPLDARPADLDPVQWAGLFAVLDSNRPGKTRGKPVG